MARKGMSRKGKRKNENATARDTARREKLRTAVLRMLTEAEAIQARWAEESPLTREQVTSRSASWVEAVASVSDESFRRINRS